MYRFDLLLDTILAKEKSRLVNFGKTLERLEIEVIKFGGNTNKENCQKYNEIKAELDKQDQFFYQKLFYVIKNSDLQEELKVHKEKLDELVRLHKSKGEAEMSDSCETSKSQNKSKHKSTLIYK